MEVKIQILTIIPSIKELKENSLDIISILINYESNLNQFCIPNLEKAILNKEVFCYKIPLNNQIPILNIELSLMRNSSIISSTNFILTNETKWINLFKINEGINHNQKNNFLIKIHLKCKILNYLNLNEKENYSFRKINNFTSREMKIKSEDENIGKIKYSKGKDINLKKKINHQNSDKINNNEKKFDTELYYYTARNDKFKKYISLNNINNNNFKKPFSIKSYCKKKKKNDEEKDIKHNSQMDFKVNALEQLNEIRNELTHKRKLSKLEEEIINSNYKNSIKNDFNLYQKKFFNHNSTESLFLYSEKKNNIRKKLNTINDNFELKKKDFFSIYTNEYIKNIDNDMLQLETQIILEKIFDLIKNFNIEKKELLKMHDLYKSTFIDFSLKYIDLSKKYDKLKNTIRKFELNKINNNLNKNYFTNFHKEEPKLFLNEFNLWKNVINNCNIINNMENIKNEQLKEIFLNITYPIKNKLNSLSKKFVNDLHDKTFNLEYTFSNENSNSIYSKNTIGTSSSTLLSSNKKKKITKKNKFIKINFY